MYWTIEVSYLDYDGRKNSKAYVVWGESPADALLNLSKTLEDYCRELEVKVLPTPFALDNLMVAEVISTIGN